MTDRKGITPITAPVAPVSSADDIAAHLFNEQQGGFKVFLDLSDRTAFTTTYKSRLFGSVAWVQKDDNGYPSMYLWSGVRKDGTDGDWTFLGYLGGVVLTDADGAIPKLRSTLVLGEDFAIQAAGDNGLGALIQLSDKIKQVIASATEGGDGMITVGGYQNADSFEKGNTLELEWPLSSEPDGSKPNAIRVTMDHQAFEPLHKPSFLTYLSTTEEIKGKTSAADGHHDGTIWFDKIVWPTGLYISTDRPNKSYTIQEADMLDPNVTGGTDYLIAYRIHMKGTAPDDGFVRIYLYNKSVNPFEPKGLLTDVNGEPMAVERHYKTGDQLGTLEAVGVVNAKGEQSFTCHIVDNFSDDLINITDPYNGESGLLIQAITSESSTGMGRLQYEQDTQQIMHEGKHYLGVDRFTIAWYLQKDVAITAADAGYGMTSIDGTHFYNLTNIKAGVENNLMVIEDNGTDIADFSFGKIFPSEETQMLRGRDVRCTVTIEDKDSGYIVAMLKWIGSPDKYPIEIFKSRHNGSPNFQTDWIKTGEGGISEDAVVGEHQQHFDFTVPGDANNYAIIIYPTQAQSPLTLKIKQFQIDVITPFNGYSMKTSKKTV